MMEKFGYKNSMAVPRIKKVVVNSGFGRQVAEKSGEEQKRVENSTMQDLSLICGQKPVFKKAKKSIAAFKLREGLNIGIACVLRRKKMYDFLDRLIHIVLPRSRDFRGIESAAFDEAGNLTIGMKEHIAFPEILSERAKSIFGLEITITTNAKNKEKGIQFLKLMGFPIKK